MVSSVPHTQVLSYGATLHFVLMDHDFLSNDFGGEAYLQVSNVSGVHGKQSKNLAEEKPISLHLMPGVTKGRQSVIMSVKGTFRMIFMMSHQIVHKSIMP